MGRVNNSGAGTPHRVVRARACQIRRVALEGALLFILLRVEPHTERGRRSVSPLASHSLLYYYGERVEYFRLTESELVVSL